VQADRYLSDVKGKPGLKPNADWDGSVVSLLNYPQVLKMMNDDLNWTQQMGQAVVNQQKDILVAIQQLRDKAVADNIIKSDDKVIVEQQNDNVIIRPAKKEVTYVPQYDPVILTSPTYVYSQPPIYYGDPYPSYYYPYAPYWAGFITGAAFGAIVDWDDWHSWGGNDVDININDIDINNFKWDRNNINNINWDNKKFNFDRDSIANNLKRNNFDRLDRKKGLDRGGLSNLAGGGNNKITGRDVRRDVQQGLKNKGGQAGKNLSGQTLNRAGDKIGQGGNKIGQGGNKIGQGGGKNLGGQANKINKPARNKSAGANRPVKKPAGKIDRRPSQMSGLGDYGRGRQVREFSNRGNFSRGGGGGRHGGGGGRIRRR
ncbi:MAG: DUF3300 domain-containing protein, partial [Parvibaculaceae bacterium]